MSDQSRFDPVLQSFTEEMRKKLLLPKNVDKPHWTECDLSYLLERLDDEVAELKVAVENHCSPKDNAAVRSEAADVANFAMMIADWCQ